MSRLYNSICRTGYCCDMHYCMYRQMGVSYFIHSHRLSSKQFVQQRSQTRAFLRIAQSQDSLEAAAIVVVTRRQPIA